VYKYVYISIFFYV
ncbi:hypothetical protein EAG_08650, partial [Camponotus floridanus]